MFFELVARNSKRNRKANALFFSSLLVVIIAFYIILSLSHQDVMVFLAKMESDAVNKLLLMIPFFYGITLVILFFLVYFASKYQMEQRTHEFGVYLMMGMSRPKLFLLLLAEDFQSSIISLLVGFPVALLISEIVSLVTARMVGLGIVGHRFSISIGAVIGTAVGFILIKFLAFIILSGRIARQEIGSLLVDTPEGTKKQKAPLIYMVSLIAGVILLGSAYYLAISGSAWQQVSMMGISILLGFTGTILLFYGLRSFMDKLARKEKKHQKLQTFTFRQLQENIIRQSTALAISSLLILAALCCFGAGVAMTKSYGDSGKHIIDYTFTEQESAAKLQEKLLEENLQNLFSSFIEMRIGHISMDAGFTDSYTMPNVLEEIEKLPASPDKDVLINNLAGEEYPYLISLSGYNEMRVRAGLPELSLNPGEAAVYRDSEFTTPGRTEILNEIFKTKPEVMMGDKTYHLTGEVQTINIVADRSITLSFALIIPDAEFETMTEGNYEVYINAIMNPELTENTSLLMAILDVNEQLNDTGLAYESYLQSMGRQLFYSVAASYITIYLAIIFLIIANTVIGVQFLTQQRKSKRRYQTLIRLGASYEALCYSAKRQINWYFGIPILVAVFSSIFGIWSLLSGFLTMKTQPDIPILLFISMSMVFLLGVVECIYIMAVKRTSNRYLLSLIVPEREE